MAAKKMPKGMYQRGDVYYSCVAGADGKMIRKRLSEDLPTAKLILQKMRHDADLQRAGVIEQPRAHYLKRLDDVRTRYVDHMLSGKTSESTVDTFLIAWAQVIHKNQFVYLSDITLAKVEIWAKNRLENEGTRGQTINLYVGQISRALGWAVKARLIQVNPLDLWTPVRPNESLHRRDLTADEIGAILRAEESVEWRIRWFVYTFTGLRRTAGTLLLWEWLDWENRTLRIPTEFNKSRRPLVLPLHDVFYSALKAWHDEKGAPTSGPVFSVIRPTSIYKRLKRVCRQAQVDTEGVTPHSFRHTFATMIYEGTGRNLKAVQELLGHASASTSMRYLHLSNAEKREAVNTLTLRIEDL